MSARHFCVFRRFSSIKIRNSNEPNKLPSLDKFTPERIRNFGIVAHVDHGKSTLADRLLQITNVIGVKERDQFLDKLQVERDRGITVKAQTCTMIYKDHMINLIDTPGHVDFSYEVSRSLVACDGILLLVAANQGVQAQTIANFWLALEANQTIVPVINKIDMPNVNVERVEQQLLSLFDFKPSDCLRISAKEGINVESVLDTIIERIPPPTVKEGPFRALLFDSWHMHYRGAVAMIVVKQGQICKGMKIKSLNNGKEYEILEVGVIHPELVPCESLYLGQVGYIITTMKTISEAVIGDTLQRPTVYAGLFPVDSKEYDNLKIALEKLTLNDNSVTVEHIKSPVLGGGWRVGFLGLLHMEVFGQRLDHDFDANVILTAAGVEYKAEIVDHEGIRKRRYDGKDQISINNPSDFPEMIQDIKCFLEPMVLVTMIVSNEQLASINDLCLAGRGEDRGATSIDEDRLLVKWRMPLAEVVINFFEEVKRISSGYASFDYIDDGYREVDLTKITLRINGRPVDEFSMICPESQARSKAKHIVQKLKQGIPRQIVEKDFATRLKGNYAADRFGKKLKDQAKGKEKLKSILDINVPKEAFLSILRK
ncbi:elongation factor tu GTP binding domain-containing protein [Ditylenchus destructor]|nr:elongation factor tu GTP binding domain-containing protein [Ditylenchus destructor]